MDHICLREQHGHRWGSVLRATGFASMGGRVNTKKLFKITLPELQNSKQKDLF